MANLVLYAGLIILLRKLFNFITAIVKLVILKLTALTLYTIIIGKPVILRATILI
jgi:hypothetical protein